MRGCLGVRPSADHDDPERRVESWEACKLLDVHRTTLWRWIQAGLPFEREMQHPHRYFYRLGDLQRMKLQRSQMRIAVPKRSDDEYDYG